MHLPPSLSFSGFQQALDLARQRFTALRQRHPSLKGWLVLALRGEQISLDASLDQMITTFPSLLAEGPPRSAMKTFLKHHELKRDATAHERDQWHQRFQQLLPTLEFNPEPRIEIRFDHLDFPLIARLKEDELTDRQLTPRTPASINIVLGSLPDFVKP